MPRMDSDEVIFHDASVYFSKEEWMLLQEWQKELYRNVMKEIHQALLSLGPLIMTAMDSLKAKEKKEQFTMANQSSECRTRIPPGSKMGNHDVLLSIDSKEALHLKIPPDPVGSDRGSCSKEGFQFVDTDMCLRKDEGLLFIDHLEVKTTGIRERNCDTTLGSKMGNHDLVLGIDSKEALHLKIPPDPVGSDRGSCSREGFQFVDTDISLRKEKESVFIDHIEAKMTEIRESNCDTTLAGYEVVSFHIKDEAESFCMDLQDNDEIGINSSPSDNGSVNRKFEHGNSVNISDKIISCIGTEGQTSLIHSSENETTYRNYTWSEGHQNQCQSMIGYPKHVRLQQPVTHVDTLPPFREYESATNKFKQSACLSNAQDDLESTLYTEHKRSLCQNEIPVIPQRPHKISQLYSRMEREKNFTWERNSITHQKIHLRERPYLCADCGKSFSKKAYLIRHKKIHTGERPFLCVECGKCFNQKEVLVRHSKIHTGEKPYCCAECGKDFIQKGHLIRHQKTHYQLK